MNPRALIPLGVIALLVGGGYLIDRQRSARESRLSGFFESQPTNVASRVSGRVGQILIKEGDTVKKGQRLLLLDATPDVQNSEAKAALAEQSRAALAEAIRGPRAEDIAKQEGVVAEARADLAKLVNGNRPEDVRAARERFAAATAEFDKAVNGARPQEIEEARAAERLAQQKLLAAERGPTAEERAQSAARLAQGRATEELARREQARYRDLYTQGAVSKQILDKAEADYASAQARVRELEESTRQTERGTPKEELAQAREAFRQAQAHTNLVVAGTRREDIEQARAQMEQARENMRLLENGARPEDIAAARARVQTAEAQLAQLRNGTRKEDIEQARAGAKAAERTAAAASVSAGERVVVAPFDGVVDRILVADGDLLGTGEPVVRMSDPTDIWLRVYVSEGQLSKIRIGDKATLRIDGLEDTISGRVESIANKGEFTPANLQTPEERAKQVFAVRLRLDPTDPRVKAGMSATVRQVGQWP